MSKPFIQRLIESYRHREPGIEIGVREGEMFLNKEYLTDSQLNHHVHVVGASGFGKSVLLTHIIRETINQGKGLLFLDLKTDMETINQVRRFAQDAGRESDLKIFSISNPDISCRYNLLQNGSATQLRDRIMCALDWSEEYYKNVSSSFLLKVLTALVWRRENGEEEKREFGVHDVLACASSTDYLEELIKQIPESSVRVRKAAEEAYMFVKDKEGQRSLMGLRTQLESLTLSDFGHLLVPEERLLSVVGSDAEFSPLEQPAAAVGENSALMALPDSQVRTYPFSASCTYGINLFDAVQDQQIVYLLLDTRRYSESARALGRFVLADLRATSAKIDAEVAKVDRKPFTVIVDEFSDIASEDFVSFLDRVRSSRISVVVAHQELSDLRRVSPEFANRLIGNTSTTVAFLQKSAESVEALAAIAGTCTVNKETTQEEGFLFKRATGMRSVRETEEYNIHPNVIRSLGVGECVVIKKYPYADAHRVRVYAPE